MLPLKPDMASLSVGSVNFPTRVYDNAPDLVDWLAGEMRTYDIKPEIEAFDLSHIVQAAKMAADGRIKGPLYVQFVMGVKNAMPADERIFDFYIETLKRLAPDALWCAAGIGADQIRVNEWSIAKGGHTRTGMEDNVRLDRTTLAPSNAALVKRAVAICEKHGRRWPRGGRPGRCWGSGRRELCCPSPLGEGGRRRRSDEGEPLSRDNLRRASPSSVRLRLPASPKGEAGRYPFSRWRGNGLTTARRRRSGSAR